MAEARTHGAAPRRQRAGGGAPNAAADAFDALERAQAELERSGVPNLPDLPPEASAVTTELTGKILDKPAPVFEAAPGPQYQDAPEGSQGEERLEHYERLIAGAQAAHDAAVDRAERYLVVTQGLALIQIRDEELWGRLGFKSFMDYVEQRLNFSRQHAYKIMQAAPVHRDLPMAGKLTFRQIAILARLSTDRRRQVWTLAEKHEDTTPAGLEKAVEELHLALSDAEPAPKTEKPPVVLLPVYSKAIKPWRDLDALEQLVRDSPEQVEEMELVLESALAKLRAARAAQAAQQES